MRFFNELYYKRFGPWELFVPYDLRYVNRPYAPHVFQQRLQGMVIPFIGFGSLLILEPLSWSLVWDTLVITLVCFELLGQSCLYFEQKYPAAWLRHFVDILAASCFQLLQGFLLLWLASSAMVLSYRTILTLLNLDREINLNELSDDYRETALIDAISCGEFEIVHRLLDRGVNIHARDQDGGTALRCAAYHGYLHIAERLLDQGADVDAQDHRGITVLMYAAYRRYIEMMQLLLMRGADINARDHDGRTILRCAAYYAHMDIVQYVLDRGADIDIQNEHGSTALMCAAYHGHVAIVRLLLDRGADLYRCNHEHRMALMDAAYSGHIVIVQLLLDRGADANARDHLGRTVLFWAANRGHMDVAVLLIKQGTKFEGLNIERLPETGASAFSNAIAQGFIEESEILLHQDPGLLNQVNQFGQTPLMRAVICGELAAVSWLIDQGAEIHMASHDGLTALYFATKALIAHRHEDEASQAPYRDMLETVSAYSSIDLRTQSLIEQDTTGNLRNLIYGSDYGYHPPFK